MKKTKRVIIQAPCDIYSPEYVFQAIGVGTILEAGKHWDESYRVLFMPSFHPEVCITVQIKPNNSCVSLATAQTSLWGYESYLRQEAKEVWPEETPPPPAPERWEETKEVSHVTATGFVRQMKGLHPLSISDLETLSLDGMSFQGEYCNASGQQNLFSAINPPDKSEQYKFAHALYTLATETLEEEASIKVLEHIYCYLGLGMPIKDLGGDPHCVRIFGTLSSSYEEELKRLLSRLPASGPLLMDMSNSDGMGALLYRLFQGLLKRRRLAKTMWWASFGAKRNLVEMGIPQAQIFDSREDALEALKAVE